MSRLSWVFTIFNMALGPFFEVKHQITYQEGTSKRFIAIHAFFFFYSEYKLTLRKHTYSNIMNFTTKKKKKKKKKNEKIQIKILIFFIISAQKLDCGYSLETPRRGGSNEYPQSMFLNRNKKNNVPTINPCFTM